MLKFGIITEVDTKNGLARVHFTDDDIVSGWLQVSSPKTLKDKFSIPFDVNEQVWCLMDGDAEFGVIGGAIYSTKDLPGNNINSGDVAIHFDDGMTIEYNREKRILTLGGNGDFAVNIPTGKVNISCMEGTVKAATKLEIDAPIVEMKGLLNVAGVMTAGGIATSAPAPGLTTGDATITGKLKIAGDIETTGTVIAGTVDLKKHIHIGVMGGPGTSGPPKP